jgi:hypothetical protein
MDITNKIYYCKNGHLYVMHNEKYYILDIDKNDKLSFVNIDIEFNNENNNIDDTNDDVNDDINDENYIYEYNDNDEKFIFTIASNNIIKQLNSSINTQAIYETIIISNKKILLKTNKKIDTPYMVSFDADENIFTLKICSYTKTYKLICDNNDNLTFLL